MKEILYNQSSMTISLALMALMALTIEVGFRLGISNRIRSNAAKDQVSTIQSSLLGILALMLGFTFSMALTRFDSRSDAVVNETNAIGTAYLRAGLLPEPARGKAQIAIRNYLDLRVQAASLALDNHRARDPLLGKAAEAQDAIWNDAMQTSRESANPATTGLYIQALNQMFDAYGTRIAELNRHVPELVLFMLYSSFIVTGGIIGYTAGVNSHRPATASQIMIVLVVLLMGMVVDLDHPRRGFIKVNQQCLLDLNAALNATHQTSERLGAQP
jgi:hypothetical protein